jgi:hypothetical protein
MRVEGYLISQAEVKHRLALAIIEQHCGRTCTGALSHERAYAYTLQETCVAISGFSLFNFPKTAQDLTDC